MISRSARGDTHADLQVPDIQGASAIWVKVVMYLIASYTWAERSSCNSVAPLSYWTVEYRPCLSMSRGWLQRPPTPLMLKGLLTPGQKGAHATLWPHLSAKNLYKECFKRRRWEHTCACSMVLYIFIFFVWLLRVFRKMGSSGVSCIHVGSKAFLCISI